jgi:hypothetical protein
MISAIGSTERASSAARAVWGCKMGFSVVMWSVWGISAFYFIGVRLYVVSLGRDENDQVLLHAGLSHLQAEQSAIADHLKKVEPLQRVALGLLGAMSLVVAVYYVVDMIRQFQ